ncbi:hypothetical protein ACFY20_41285 [Streptomyces sp. NPDC001312]|uniref:hypothetical protein n=1 Tax=Streptomyces sp. NPDC001312 TaxID=3364561 RepID=UPI0036D1CC56
MDWATVDGRNIDAPSNAGAWVEFGYDNMPVGDYGCMPFKASATVTATTLTVGAQASRAVPDDACPAKAVSGPSDGVRRQPLTTSDDHEGATHSRALMVCLPS